MSSLKRTQPESRGYWGSATATGGAFDKNKTKLKIKNGGSQQTESKNKINILWWKPYHIQTDSEAHLSRRLIKQREPWGREDKEILKGSQTENGGREVKPTRSHCVWSPSNTRISSSAAECATQDVRLAVRLDTWVKLCRSVSRTASSIINGVRNSGVMKVSAFISRSDANSDDAPTFTRHIGFKHAEISQQ